jgi:curved DNA-binding protein CbpA
MAVPDWTDHYEVLQVSSRADAETIQRVFRHLAKRFHPDNAESGDAARFKQLMESFGILSDPALRARYDVADDRRMRTALLSLLYTARRNDSDRAGLGELELERVLGCPETHLKFHVWYLKENGLIRRTESGALAITATGVDAVLEAGGPGQPAMHLLEAGESKRSA